MSKSKIVLVVDLCSSTLSTASSILRQYVSQRLYNFPENMISLVLVGTSATDVSLINGDVGDFNNITVAKPLLSGDKSLIEAIQNLPNEYENRTAKKCLVRGLEVAVRLFHQEKAKTHWMSENRIMLFTDEFGTFSTDYSFVATEMNGIKPQIVFKLIGPDLESSQNLGGNLAKMSALCAAVEQGESLSNEDALTITNLYKTKKVRQTPIFKGCLEIGGGTKFPVHVINKITPTSHQQSLKMCGSGGEAVVRDRVYKLKDQNQTRVDPDSMNKGYRYGKTYIPISKVDASLMSRETEKELCLICTTKRSNIRKEEFCGKYAYSVVAPPNDTTGGTALAAFAIALKEMDMVAVCRYVKKDDTPPKLCCLVPNVKDYCATLHMIELPFSNDIKKAVFPKIRYTPSQDQLTAVDKLIDNMDLNSKPEFKESEMSNPGIQRRYQCVVHRALQSDSPLPEVDVSDLIKLPSFDTSDAVKECNKYFEVKLIEKKPTKRTAGEMFSTDNIDVTNDIKKVKKEDISLDDLLGAEVKIGTTRPVADFQLACSKLGPNSACTMMCDVISQLVQHSGSNIPQSLRALRERCVKEGFHGIFNNLLRKEFQYELFKKICKEEEMSLIHKGECEGSPVSAVESEVFLKGDELVKDMESDDDDDLLDML